MEPMELPELLKGGWQNALFMTYGLDALFFENAIMPVLGNSCRNRIILADGKRFLEACENYADSNLLRFLNQRYIAEGIFVPNAAHAKLILLTHPERGRLLAGSGNLNMLGYASGGKLFTQYDWSAEDPASLSAFQAALDLLHKLIDAGLLSETVRSHMDYMLENTPWLNRRAAAGQNPLRHNVDEPFLMQFAQVIGDEPVEELWIMAPFYDRRARALQEMLVRLKPGKVKLLIQLGRTSAVPEALQSVIDESMAETEVLAISPASEDTSPYYHAKLYLAKLAGRAICLQGSPNLSQVAMLRTARDGNIELANLLGGERDGFDQIFSSLSLDPITLDDPDLDLSYQSDERESMEAAPAFQLFGGEWQGERLSLEIDGDLPPLDRARLNINDEHFPLHVLSQNDDLLVVQLSEPAVEALSRSVPLFIEWETSDIAEPSNPIFVYNLAGLRYELAAPTTRAQPDKFGSLDIEDEELEFLIDDLQAHMVLDQESIWQLANRHPPAADSAQADDSQRIAYEDVDYETLRRHPRIRQYTERDFVGGTRSRSRLQILLSSITDHFQGLVDTAYAGKQPAAITTFQPLEEELDADLEDEVEEEEAAREKRRQKLDSRLRNIFKHFIRRYLRGLRSPEFQQMAGYEVVSYNAIIFSHLLWRLSQKEFFADDPDFLVESMIKTWQLFWGSGQYPGYFASLSVEEQQEILERLRESHGDAIILASLFWAEQVTRNNPELRMPLRDFWRHLLINRPFPIDKGVIKDTWLLTSEMSGHEPPRPSRIFAALKRLADFTQDKELLALLDTRYGPGKTGFARSEIFSESADRRIFVKCLVLTAAGALADKDEGLDLLREWMRFEKLNHYRIAAPDANRADRQILYETGLAEGLYFDRTIGDMEEFQDLSIPVQPWSTAQIDLIHEARVVDQEMTFPLSKERAAFEKPLRFND